MKKKNITLSQVIDFLYEKGITLSHKGEKNFSKNQFKNFFLTSLCSLILISFFLAIPIIIEFKDSNIVASKEIKDNSNGNFKKVLKGESLVQKQKIDEELDIRSLLDDIIKFDVLPSDTVRLSAATIQELFKDTKYNLKDVRETKLVKPITLELLPEQMSSITSTKKKKDLFIQIILPLILAENNIIKLDRKKLFSILNKNSNSQKEKDWLNKRFKQYGVVNKDLATLKIRMDEIPASLAIAQAAKETGWGTSRFALEGNALFGQWTWSGEGIKPAGADDNTNHKVMKFKVLKASVRAYQRNLNTHAGYKDFRIARANARDKGVNLNSLVLVDHLQKYAATGVEYIKILKQIIKQNNLTDFDNVKLLPLSINLKSLI